jgi:hypothetical protein
LEALVSVLDSNEALIAGILLALALAATESGFRLGRRAKSQVSEGTKALISVIAGSVLGVVGLLLGFTISMAVSRFEMRKQLVLEEANAIGTSFLRTQLLPEQDRDYISSRLRQYVYLRTRHVRAGDDLRILNDPAALKAAREESTALQKDFWTRAVSCARKDPNMVPTGMLLQSLNQVIDLDAARWMAYKNHVPEAVIYVDSLVALLATTLIGYSIGLAGERHFFSESLLCLAIVLVISVVIDIDRPRRGMVTVDQQPMLDLQQQLSSR